KPCLPWFPTGGRRVGESCPSQEELLAFHLGRLPDGEVDALTEHLEKCARCEAVVQSLDSASDPLLVALRKPVPAPTTFVHQAARGSWATSFDEEHEGRIAENGSSPPGYEILGRLGQGAMGAVFKARQKSLGRLVALKRLQSGSVRGRARFQIEAEALARLRHPNIVQIYEVLEFDGRMYLALEL